MRCDHFMYSKKTSFFNMFHVYCFCVKCTWWFFLIIIHFGMYFIYDRFFVSVQYQIYLSLLVTVLGFWNRYIIYVRNFAFQWILYVRTYNVTHFWSRCSKDFFILTRYIFYMIYVMEEQMFHSSQFYGCWIFRIWQFSFFET